MNNLSWLLYLGDVCDSLKGVGVAFAILTALILGFAALVKAAEDVDLFSTSTRRMLIGMFFTGTLVATLFPSQRTIYLIAASEVGQQVAQSDTGKAVTDEVRKLILKKLQKLNEAAQ